MGNMMRNLQEMDDMSGPRIIKTHIPFKLLNPKLLDTSKVSRFMLLISIAVPVFFFGPVFIECLIHPINFQLRLLNWRNVWSPMKIS